MAHRGCLKKVEQNTLGCSCISDDLIELELIKNNLRNIDKIVCCAIDKYASHYQITEQVKNHIANNILIRLLIENE